MQETPSNFMKNFLLNVPTRKMPNLLDTYNTYIEEASFCRHTMRSSALGIQRVKVEKIIKIGE
jgi:hypothetical protein